MYKKIEISKIKTVAEKLSKSDMSMIGTHFIQRHNYLYLPDADYILNDKLRVLCKKLILWHAGYYKKGFGMVLWHLYGFNKITK